METIRNKTTGSETSATIDLAEELSGVPKAIKAEILDSIGELLVERTLNALASERSPVEGHGTFKGLSQEYKKLKQSETGSGKANLDLTGSMINSIDFNVSGNKITIGVFGEDAPKADGHNNLSGASSLPTRRFIPEVGESYTSDIKQLILDEIRSKKAENADFSASDLNNIETKDELYALLSEVFGDESRSKVKEAVLGTAMRELLDEFDLLKLL